MINAASNVDELRSPPGNRLKKLKGDLSMFFGLRVNDQWRIVFHWSSEGARDVKLTDYHD